jgi:hypothetical protein
MGPVRLLPVDRDGGEEPPGAARARPSAGGLAQWLVVADAPLDRYGEHAINRGLSDLDWVSRAAVAHEAVVESFISAPALLPMKLFTIFTSDARAVEDVRRNRGQIQAALERVVGRLEWGVRVMLDPRQADRSSTGKARRRAPHSGAAYLAQKKAQRDATTELASRAPEVIAELYDRLAAVASRSTRRAAGELPARAGQLLLDAAFLVPRSRGGPFRAAVARQAKRLAPQGYAVLLSGPWPPYSFMKT